MFIILNLTVKIKKNQYIKILKNVHLIDNFYIDIYNDK